MPIRSRVARILLFLPLASVLAAAGTCSAEPLSFKDKRIMMVIGNAAGGQTDLVGRIYADSLGKHLPGRPQIVVLNQPGAEGITALNSFTMEAKPDGLSVTVGAASQSDPLIYRTAKAVFDLTKFVFVAGTGQAGTGLFINKKALARVHDRSAAPVTMGALSALRTGMYMNLWGREYLGWNSRWVLGYRSTAELRQALLRGEVDMTSLGSIDDIKVLLDTGNFDVLAQSGRRESGQRVPRPELGSAPIMAKLLAGKIVDPAAKQAFTYWENICQVSSWLALPPATPKPIVTAYRQAMQQVFVDPVFRARIEKLLPGAISRNADEEQALENELAKTSPEALDYLRGLERKQGIQIRK